MSNLLRHYGLHMSEAMVFGLSSAISFAYLPFIKLGGLPLIAYRMPPKAIIKGLQRPLSLKIRFETFHNPDQGMARLNEHIDDGEIVGLQTSVYWLPYFPEDLRFHFNGHNLLVYGREGDDYLISDPVLEDVVKCPSADLKRSRFAKGVLAPKGLIYRLIDTPKEPEWDTAIRAAIKKTTRIMLKTPLPIIGTKGINRLANAIRRLPAGDDHESKLFVGHVIRMQEEIGTGGAGFRFIYAAFLQEASEKTNLPELAALSQDLLWVGDQWREFALVSARMLRGREPFAPAHLAEKLGEIAKLEHKFFGQLKQAIS